MGADDVGAPHRRKRIWIVAYPNDNSKSIGSEYERQRCRKLGEEGDVANSISTTSRGRTISGEVGNERGSSSRTEPESIQPRNRETRSGDTQPGSKNVAHSKCNSQRPSHRGNFGISSRGWEEQGISEGNQIWCNSGDSSEDVAYSKSKRVEGYRSGGEQESHTHGQEGLPLCEGERPGATEGSIRSSIRGMVDGIPEGLHKDVMWQKEPEDINRVSMGVKDRVQRLKGLGNSICPQVAYEIMKLLK